MLIQRLDTHMNPPVLRRRHTNQRTQLAVVIPLLERFNRLEIGQSDADRKVIQLIVEAVGLRALLVGFGVPDVDAFVGA